jgi:Caspase domain
LDKLRTLGSNCLDLATMKRREFLRLSAAAAGTLAAPSVLSRAQAATTRAAVVIGVKKAGNLPILTAAADGARSFATWLQSEGFEVKLFVDDAKPVRVGDIIDAIFELVERATLEQLVVYFSGHGFLNSWSEHWLLSKAPHNPNEAISLVESHRLAKQSGIPNVVFISDACRSTPDSLGTSQVRGNLIFPNDGVSTGRADVDEFLASLPGNPALELPVNDSVKNFEGIFTSCFLDAFKRPDAEMVRTLANGTKVIPNRRLSKFLVREVQRKAQARSIKLNQIPDADVVSDETAYIGRVAGVAEMGPGRNACRTFASSTPILEQSISDYASSRLAGLGVETRTILRPPVANFSASPAEAEFEAAQRKILDSQLSVGLDTNMDFESRTGFSVFGAHLADAVGNPTRVGAKIIYVRPSTDPATFVDVETRQELGSSVALHFTDGSAAVVAALPGYIGNVVVQDGGVSNVSYIPSRENPRWSIFQSEQQRLDQLRAAVATAAQFGVFRLEGDRESRAKKATELADQIRVLKAIDPTLGIYAAYAYAAADLIDEVRSVRQFMLGLGTDLFDVALLAGALDSDRHNPDDGVVPACPMLSQGWALLRVMGVRLPKEYEEARDHLRPALWTTFEPPGARIVIDALAAGRLR